MKKIIHTIVALAFSMGLLFNTACESDLVEKEIPETTDSFTLQLATGNSFTRVLTMEDGDKDGSFNENKIDKLDLFFYNGTTLKWHVSSTGLTYDATTKQATIPVPSAKRSLFTNNTSTTYDIYVVANNKANLSSILEGGSNLTDLKNLVFQTSDFESKGGSAVQTSFVMDGKISSKIASLTAPDLGTVDLKRAASKIRLRLIETAVPGYTVDGDIVAQLVHFTDKSVLLEDGTPFEPQTTDWKETLPKSVSRTYNTSEHTTSFPFYAYSNDWSSDPEKETYIELYIPLKNSSNVTETYKYYVPITPQDQTGDYAQYMNKLQRNFLYDIAVSVNILGSIDDVPVTVPGNYRIIDWNTQDVAVDILGMHYLVVSERNVIMPNVNTYTLTFNSSIANVTLVSGSLKATYTYVNYNTGNPVTSNCTGNQIPTIAVESNCASGTITITSTVPVNFIPKDIEFKITNGVLTQTVIVRQLPASYFTSEKGNKSSLRPTGNWSSNDPSERNRYMYIINTLAPAGDIIWGFPPLDANGNTINSAEVANMVSPRFMMASQLGATTTMGYTAAATNCRDYWEETTKNSVTVRYEDWRLPTEAEIKYLDNLQWDNNNPQGMVMSGNWYWDAYSGNNAYQMKGGTSGGSTSAHVRCIRDIKD